MNHLAETCLSAYQALAENQQNGQPVTGVTLPAMQMGSVNIDTTYLSADEVIQEIQTFAADSGWTLYRDKLDMSATAPSDTFFIEGEWSKGENAVHIKLIEGDRYLCTRFRFGPEHTDSVQSFRDQTVFVRKLGETQALKTARYRLWWQLDENSKWRPLAQQFCGFDQDKKG